MIKELGFHPSEMKTFLERLGYDVINFDDFTADSIEVYSDGRKVSVDGVYRDTGLRDFFRKIIRLRLLTLLEKA